MEFVCPIGGAGAGLPPWHAVVHLGLTAIVVTSGVILLVAGVIAFRASAPAARHGTASDARWDPSTSPLADVSEAVTSTRAEPPGSLGSGSAAATPSG